MSPKAGTWLRSFLYSLPSIGNSTALATGEKITIISGIPGTVVATHRHCSCGMLVEEMDAVSGQYVWKCKKRYNEHGTCQLQLAPAFTDG